MSIVVNASLNTQEMKKGADDAEKQVDRIIDSVAELDKKQEKYEATEKRRREKAAREQRKAEQEAAKAAEAARIKAEKEAARAALAAEKTAERQINANKAVTTNLVGQFNDIGVMLAAGQNPLQLAMQQGTQVSAALQGLQGGVGPLRALGDAFKGFVNPMSLATLGIIGVGAALGNYIIPKIGELIPKTKTAQERTEELKTSTDNYVDSLERAKIPLADMIQKYGHLATAIMRSNEAKVEADRAFVERDLKQQAKAMSAGFPKDTTGMDKAVSPYISDEDSLSLYEKRKGSIKIEKDYGATPEQAIALAEAMTAYDNAIQNGNYHDASLILANLKEIAAGIAKNGNLTDDQIAKQDELTTSIDASREAVDALYNTEDKLVENAAKAQIKRVEGIADLKKKRAEQQNKLAEAQMKGDEVASQKALANINSIDAKLKETGETFASEQIKWGDKFTELEINGVSLFDTLMGKVKELGLSMTELSLDNLVPKGNATFSDKPVEQGLYNKYSEDYKIKAEKGNDQLERQIYEAAVVASEISGAAIEDIMAVWHRESTWNPSIIGTDKETGKKYHGLTQFGGPEREKYGVTNMSTPYEQGVATGHFLKDRGFKPGMGLAEVDATILAGNPGAVGKKDANGTISGNVNTPEYRDRLARSSAVADIYSGNEAGIRQRTKEDVQAAETVRKEAEATAEANLKTGEAIQNNTELTRQQAEIEKWYGAEVEKIRSNKSLTEQDQKKAIIEVEVERAKRLELMRLENELKEKGIALDAQVIEGGKTYAQLIQEQANATAEKTRQELINKNATELHTASQKLQNKELKDSAKVSQEMARNFGNVFSGIITGSMKAKDALKSLIAAIANNLIRNVGNWANGGGGGGGWAQWLFGSIGSAAAGSFSKHADGGMVSSNLQLVGERSAELVSLPKGSRVHNGQSTARMLKGMGQGQNITLQIVSDGSFRASVIEESARNSVKIVDQNLKVYDKGSQNRIRNFQKNPYKA